jgi:hypothetical protein
LRCPGALGGTRCLLPHADWDAATDCLDRVAAALDKQPGGIAARTWGERNTARITHPISRALPGFVARLLDMPADPLPGDSNMPRVQGPKFGASERFAVAPGDEEHGYFELPGGQSGHPLSPFYGAGHDGQADVLPGRCCYRPTDLSRAADLSTKRYGKTAGRSHAGRHEI